MWVCGSKGRGNGSLGYYSLPPTFYLLCTWGCVQLWAHVQCSHTGKYENRRREKSPKVTSFTSELRPLGMEPATTKLPLLCSKDWQGHQQVCSPASPHVHESQMPALALLTRWPLYLDLFIFRCEDELRRVCSVCLRQMQTLSTSLVRPETGRHSDASMGTSWDLQRLQQP